MITPMIKKKLKTCSSDHGLIFFRSSWDVGFYASLKLLIVIIENVGKKFIFSAAVEG